MSKEKPLTYEEILKARIQLERELKELHEEFWGLKDLGENLLLQPPNLENN